MSEFYDEKGEDLNPNVKDALLELTNKEELNRMDEILLKGVYSNCRVEQGNPRNLDKNAHINLQEKQTLRQKVTKPNNSMISESDFDKHQSIPSE